MNSQRTIEHGASRRRRKRSAVTVAEQTNRSEAPTAPIRVRALIIGSGFSGLGMAIALQKRGVDFVILEKADDVGGTWRDNSYPGAACDVPSHLYSFSFEPNPAWKHLFSFQDEILDYLRDIAEKHGLRRSISFGSMVDRAHWDDSEYRWHVFTNSGQEYRRTVLDLRCRPVAHPVPARPRRSRATSPVRRFTLRSGTTVSTSPANVSR